MGAPNSSTQDLSISSSIMLNRAGIAKYNVAFFMNLATLSNAAQCHITPGHKGRITKVTWVTHTAATTASKLATLTPSIDGTNVTGGVLALTTAAANTIDKELAGTAITAANAFTNTGKITFTGSSVTAFAEGAGWVIAELVNDELLESMALAMHGLRTP